MARLPYAGQKKGQAFGANYTDGVVVLHKGRIVYERYAGALQPDGQHIAMSVTKSFFDLLGATLVAEGQLDENAKVGRIVPELKDSAFGDASVRQLLDMRQPEVQRELGRPERRDLDARAHWRRAAAPAGRMLEDMRMRKLETRTQEAYVRAVRKLTAFLKRSPDTASVEDLRNFQLHLVDTGTSPITLNATLTGLKFFFNTMLGRSELVVRVQPVKSPRTVPAVLSVQEAAALLAATRNIKHQAALSVAYGAGLRASEVCRLKVGDVDSQRMALRVEQGKGAKDRYAMLSPVVLARLRTWWRVGRAQSKMLPGGWLFPGMARWTR